MSETITFSKDAEAIIGLIQNTNKPLFITGKAGTGKSTLLEHVSKLDPNIIVLAPTGIAAINVKGETIHSFFKLKPGYELDEARHMKINNAMIAKYAKVQTVIIDEISMVRADLLDAIDVLLQRIRNNQTAFGGIRMIFFGDLFQLPPVLLNNESEQFLIRYKSPYFFSAKAFLQKDLFSEPFQLKTCELQTIYRQKDSAFTALLNSVRTNTITPEQLQILNRQVIDSNSDSNDEFQINLVSTNAIAKRINLENLKLIDAKHFSFNASHTGNIENLRPNDSEVILKVGAQVMFINNDAQKRWVNGSIGKIVGVHKLIDPEDQDSYQALKVELENGKIVDVTPNTWEISKYLFKAGRFVREEIGTFTQIPLKLAWAITIHKSQGKTFNKVKIDLGYGSFAHGQTYVALSRCKTLEHIKLAQPILMSDIIVDDMVIDYCGSH
ncbi:MAG: hypothetical protein BM564_01310 [Bacteroidetes bacterium MedPE-SWsnd-G2]|nr:MAG: hypothetical protein BM564_01310 [Bacteroidetes bacterium MedPE-SWsnd-G2]